MFLSTFFAVCLFFCLSRFNSWGKRIAKKRPKGYKMSQNFQVIIFHFGLMLPETERLLQIFTKHIFRLAMQLRSSFKSNRYPIKRIFFFVKIFCNRQSPISNNKTKKIERRPQGSKIDTHSKIRFQAGTFLDR